MPINSSSIPALRVARKVKRKKRASGGGIFDWSGVGEATPENIGREHIVDPVVTVPKSVLWDLPHRAIDAANQTSYGLRREDYTDVPPDYSPDQSKFIAPLGLPKGGWQPTDDLIGASLEGATNVMGGTALSAPVRAGEEALGAGIMRRDPSLWHDISKVKLPRPVSEMSAVHEAAPLPTAVPERVINPADLQGGRLLPLIGDRTGSGTRLTQVNGYKFDNPVDMQGGHGFMSQNAGQGAAWAAEKPIASGISKLVDRVSDNGPVYGSYTAMGGRSADFSHHMSDTLSEMVKQSKITKAGRRDFDDAMREVDPTWPGVKSEKLRAHLMSVPGGTRKYFAELMDTAKFQSEGFPSVAEARFATTDPRLLNVNQLASGQSIARLEPGAGAFQAADPHRTYSTNVPGQYIGGLPESIPGEVMYPKMTQELQQYADKTAAAGKMRPTIPYLMTRTPKGLARTEPVDQQWVDTVSKHLEDRGFKLGAGANDERAAAVAAAPTFFSHLERSVADVKQPAMTGQEWANVLTNAGVKGEEMDFRGLRQMLGDRAAQRITKEEVAEHLAQNPQELGERTYGAIPKWEGLTDHQRAKVAEMQEDLNGGRAFKGEQLVQWYDNVRSHMEKGYETSLDKIIQPTKYQNYQLPGGENYREKLLTLPKRNPYPKPTGDEASEIAFYAEQRRRGKNLTPEQQARDDALIAKSRAYYGAEDAQQAYRSSHWDEPNVLAHRRTNERNVGERPTFTVVNTRSGNRSQAFHTPEEAEALAAKIPGTRVEEGTEPVRSLHIEEIQSDWHQAGRKGGYREPEVEAAIGRLRSGKPTDADIDLLNNRLPPGVGTHEYVNGRVPDAPFKKNWHEVVVKDAIREAAEKGINRISWTGGRDQAKRYGLGNHFDGFNVVKEGDQLHWWPKGRNGQGGKFVTDADGKVVQASRDWGPNLVGKSVDDVVGKDFAKRVTDDFVNPKTREQTAKALQAYKDEMRAKYGSASGSKMSKEEMDHYYRLLDDLTHSGIRTNERRYSGIDLQVGGEGMRGFYDKILPDYFNKIGKPHGVKVRAGATGLDRPGYDIVAKDGSASYATYKGPPTQAQLAQIARQEGVPVESLTTRKNKGMEATVHYMDIPQSLRDEALHKGFRLGAGASDKRAAGVAGVSDALKAHAGDMPVAKPDPAQPMYLRYGKWDPKREQSQNYATGDYEYGVSAYDLDKNGKAVVPPEGEWAAEDLASRAKGEHPGYIVQGTHVGWGGDGEPLLKDVRVVGVPKKGGGFTLGAGASDKRAASVAAADDVLNAGRQGAAHEPGTAAAATPAGEVGPGGGRPFGAGSLPEAQATASRWAGERRPLEGLPGPLKINGEHFVPGPIGKIHDVAEEYMRTHHPHRPYTPPDRYHPLDPEHSKAIAQAYEEMKHTPNDPATKASYDALIDETAKQYEAIKKTGLKIEPIRPGMEDPYAANPRMAAIDVAENNHLWFYPTEQGFGTVNKISDNPMLRKTGEKLGNHDLLANDMFRIVHDYFGHLKEGHGFRAAGEDNAWRTHSAMYSDIARPAMTTETRGQNSWVNYGPHGEKNRTATAADTTYADQKVGLLPEWVMRDRGTPEPLMFYHGTPHSFNRFDISKIGAGEGNQAYGHGLYFAGHEPVSEWYRHQLATRQDPLLRKYQIADVGHVIGSHLSDAGGDAQKLAQEYAVLRDKLIANGDDTKATENMIKDYNRRIKYLNDPQRSRGHMYQVSADVDPQRLLDYDVPFVDQSQHVQERVASHLQQNVGNQIDAIKRTLSEGTMDSHPAFQGTGWKKGRPLTAGNRANLEGRLLSLEQTGYSSFPGKEIYKRMGLPAKTESEGARRAASRLLESGVPGLRYRDAGSRAPGQQGSHNYVMFSDDMLKILRKYGVVGIPAAGVLGANGEERRATGGAVNGAMEIARRVKRAKGGKVHVGPIVGDTGGRADKVPMEVPDGAYVIPADIVSGFGEGNTAAGMNVLSDMFPESKPSLMRSMRRRSVPILAADGEFVISPDSITKRWGDLDAGHKSLDAWVLKERQNLIQTLSDLDPPAQD